MKEKYTLKDYEVHIGVLITVIVVLTYIYFTSRHGNPFDNIFNTFKGDYPKAFLVFCGALSTYLIYRGIRDHKNNLKPIYNWHLSNGIIMLLLCLLIIFWTKNITSHCSWPIIRRFALYYGQLSSSVIFIKLWVLTY